MNPNSSNRNGQLMPNRLRRRLIKTRVAEQTVNIDAISDPATTSYTRSVNTKSLYTHIRSTCLTDATTPIKTNVVSERWGLAMLKT